MVAIAEITRKHVANEIKRLVDNGDLKRNVPLELLHEVSTFVTDYTPVALLIQQQQRYCFLPSLQQNAYGFQSPPKICGHLVFEDELSKMQNANDNPLWLIAPAPGNNNNADGKEHDDHYATVYQFRMAVRSKRRKEKGGFGAICELKLPRIEPAQFGSAETRAHQWSDLQKKSWSARQKMQWNLLPMPPLKISQTPSIAWFRNQLIVCGGENSDGRQMLIFDPIKRTWKIGPSMLGKLTKKTTRRLLIEDETQRKLYAFGMGHTSEAKPVEVFYNGAWWLLAPNTIYTEPVCSRTAAVVDGDRIRVFGLIKENNVNGPCVCECQYPLVNNDQAESTISIKPLTLLFRFPPEYWVRAESALYCIRRGSADRPKSIQIMVTSLCHHHSDFNRIWICDLADGPDFHLLPAIRFSTPPDTSNWPFHPGLPSFLAATTF